MRCMASYRSDILTRNLDVVFCGLNPAESAAADGHNFSNRNNRFWPVLHLAGFTDTCLCPHDERRLLRYGCGITAVVSRPTKSAVDVSSKEYKARSARVRSENSALCASLRCFSRQASSVRHDRPIAPRLGSVRGWLCRCLGVDSS